MVTIISPSNRSRGETGSTGGLLFASLRHSVRAQRTARKGQDWGSVMRCFAAAVVTCGGRGWETEQRRREPPSPQHRLQFPFESDDACARLPQHSDVARLSAPVCPVRPDKYGMAPYAVRRQSRELAAAVASCSAGSCRGNSHLPTTLQPWLGRGAGRPGTKSWREEGLLYRDLLGFQLPCRPQLLSRCSYWDKKLSIKILILPSPA